MGVNKVGSWLHISEEYPRAIKAHRCYLCGLDINTGQTHIKRVGIGEDGLCSIRMHIGCESMTKGWDNEHWETHYAIDFRKEYGVVEPVNEVWVLGERAIV